MRHFVRFRLESLADFGEYITICIFRCVGVHVNNRSRLNTHQQLPI